MVAQIRIAARLELERRQLAVMFCDIAGSCALAARMDPEEFCALLVAYRRVVAATVERFGGHVSRYVGDGVLAFWGYPRAHPDGARRALSAALAIRAAFARPGAPGLALRIGLDVGRVVVGDLAAGGAQAADVVGEAANVAAELQALGSPGDVLLTGRLRDMAGEAFAFEPCGEPRLKATRAPHPVHRLLAASAASAAARAATPVLFARGIELARLAAAAAQARRGLGRAIMIAGEAGIGKSALVEALRRHEAVAGMRWLDLDAARGRPLRDLAAGPQGLVVCLDRAEAADGALRAALQALALRAPARGLLVLAMTRGGADAQEERWDAMRLSRLDPAGLVDALDPAQRLSPPARRIAAELSEGVPLYARELVRLGPALAACGGDGAALLAGPSALAERLAAELDDLGPLLRLAQIAAALGDAADPAMVAHVAGVAVGAVRRALADAPDVFAPGGDRVGFRHGLLRAAALAGVLRARRQGWLAHAGALGAHVEPARYAGAA